MEDSHYKNTNHFAYALFDSATDEVQETEWLKYTTRHTSKRTEGEWIEPNPLMFNKNFPVLVFPDGTSVEIPEGLNFYLDADTCVKY